MWISKGREGHKTKQTGCMNGHSTKQTFFVYFYVFSLVFFHISILVLNGLLKLMMNIMIKLLLLFLLKSKRFYSVLVGEGVGVGGVGTRCNYVLQRDPPVVQIYRHTNFFWNKKYSNSDKSLLFKWKVHCIFSLFMSEWCDILIWKDSLQSICLYFLTWQH